MPVLLPRNWVSSSSRLRVNLTATSVAARARAGFSRPTALARFDWKLAIGDTTLTEEELIELAAAKEPLIRVRGRWHALRRSEVEKALLFLERRREGSVVDLVRAVSGIELEDAGLELGDVVLDDALTALLDGGDERHYEPLGTPAAMTQPALPVPGARARLAAAPRRPRDRRDPRRRHGARQDRAGDRDAHLGAGAVGADAFGPTLVVCPMSVTRQWARRSSGSRPPCASTCTTAASDSPAPSSWRSPARATS